MDSDSDTRPRPRSTGRTRARTGRTSPAGRLAMRRAYRRRGRLLAGGLALAWLAPLVAYAAGAAWLLLPIMIMLAAAQFRGGETAVDRFVLGGAVLAGALLPAALIFSWWPWGLHPVALSGAALTVLVLLAIFRMPREGRARWWRPADAVLAASAAVFGYLLLRPLVAHGRAGRLAILMNGEDLARHFSLYDVIRRLGGYGFLSLGSAPVIEEIEPVHRTYPQGMHLLLAVLDNFVTSSAGAGGTVGEIDRFAWYSALMYLLLGVAVLWGARRLAGPAAGVVVVTVLCAALVGLLYLGDMLAMYLFGFAAEVLGLAFLVLLIALLARPLADTREQLVAVTAMIGAISFTYYFLVIVMVVPVIAWIALSWRRLWRRPVWTSGTALVAAAALVLPRLLSPQTGYGIALKAPGGAAAVYLPTALALAGLVAAVAAPAVLRHAPPSTLITMVALAAAGALAGGLAVSQLIRLHQTGYAYVKAMHIALTLLLLSVGLAAAPLHRALIARPLRGRRRANAAVATAGSRLLAVGVVAALAALLTVGPSRAAAPNEAPGRLATMTLEPPRPATPGGMWGRVYLAGQLTAPEPARRTLSILRTVPDPDRRTTLLIYPDRMTTYQGTLFLAVLQRDYGTTWPGYVFSASTHVVADYPALLLRTPGTRYQIITPMPEMLDALGQVLRQRPDLDVQLIDARSLP